MADKEKDYTLIKEEELRIECDMKESIEIILLTGTAEIFGAEITVNMSIIFPIGRKVAVFTWHGCTIKVKGIPEAIYISKESSSLVHLNFHDCLQTMREKCLEDNIGPRVLVCGPTDSGKSTFCRQLINYCVRVGGNPLYIDLDVGQNSISVPGTIGAILIERPSDVVDGFDLSTPLVYQFGHLSPEHNLSLYNHLISNLRNVVFDRMNKSIKINRCGCFINTCGWITGNGLNSLEHIIKSFNVNVIVVLDQERLYNHLLQFKSDKLQVVNLPKSTGVVVRNQNYRRHVRDEKIREYFYGSLLNPFHPHVFDIAFSSVKIYRIGAPSVPNSCLPIGMEPEDNDLKLIVYLPNKNLLHCVCAISLADNEDEIVSKNVAGFIIITQVDMEKQFFTILSPRPSPLPRTFLVVSSVKYMDLK